jgi:hypothetical protein
MLRALDDTEQYRRISTEYGNAVAFNEKNFQRDVESWRFYWGLDAAQGLGQWPSSAVAEMLREGRHIATYNFVRPTVDNLAGSIMKNPFSFDFSPVSDELSTLTYAAKEMFYLDKELMDWSSAVLAMIQAGLVHEGTVEMFVSKEYDPKFGNIGLRYRLPGTVLFDPRWRTPRHKDCKKCWSSAMLTPLDMLDIFPEQAEAIRGVVMKRKGASLQNSRVSQLAEDQLLHGDQYGTNNGIYPFDVHDEEWGKAYRVITCYHMEKVRKKFEFVIGNGGNIPIPPELTTDDEIESIANKIQWMNENVPEWQPEGVFEDYTEEEVQFATSICPTLMPGVLLDDRPTEVQCGCLQFFLWSCNRSNGESSGVVASVIDLQRQVNYLESLLSYKIAVEGGGGAQFYDPDGFADGIEEAKFKTSRNNPKANFRLKTGYLTKNPRGPAIPVIKSGYPGEVDRLLTHLLDVVLPRITPVTPASQGRTEGSNESGYLFRLKKLQSDVQQFTIFAGLRNFWNEVGEAYLIQGCITYGNGIQRQFFHPASKGMLTINEHRVQDGVEVIVNDMARLKDIRHRVIVTESEDSPTRKVEIMSVAAEAMRTMPETMTLTLTKMASLLAMSIETWSDEDKEVMRRYNDLELEVAEAQMRSMLAKANAEEAQANVAANPPPPMPGGPGGPPPGAGGPGGPQPMQRAKPALDRAEVQQPTMVAG